MRRGSSLMCGQGGAVSQRIDRKDRVRSRLRGSRADWVDRGAIANWVGDAGVGVLTSSAGCVAACAGRGDRGHDPGGRERRFGRPRQSSGRLGGGHGPSAGQDASSALPRLASNAQRCRASARSASSGSGDRPWPWRAHALALALTAPPIRRVGKTSQLPPLSSAPILHELVSHRRRIQRYVRDHAIESARSARSPHPALHRRLP